MLTSSFHWARLVWLTDKPPELANSSASSSISSSALSKGALEPDGCPRTVLLGALGGRERGTRWPPLPRSVVLVRWLRRMGAVAAEFARCLTLPPAPEDDPPRKTPPFPLLRPVAAEDEPPKFSWRAKGCAEVALPSPAPAPARGGR